MRCPSHKTLARFLSLHSLTPNSLRTMSSGSTQRMFQLKLDPLTGNSEWVVIEEDDAPEDSPGPLLANTSYLDMLNDTPRNRAYRRAIEKTLTKPCHVLDIGAGTGLLSMMAARAMDGVSSASSKGTVTACESYLPMFKLMRKVLRANGLERKVRIINKRSDELEVGVNIPSRADFLDENRREEEREWQGKKYLLHYFDYEAGSDKYVIWAITAGFLITTASIVYKRAPAFSERKPHFWQGK